MKFTHLCLLTVLLTPSVSGQEAPGIERLAFWAWETSAQLDRDLKAIDHEMAELPAIAATNTCLRVGFKTALTTGDNLHWLEVELPAETLTDTVVLAPAVAKAATAIVAGYGFPVRFVVEAFDAGGRATVVLDSIRITVFEDEAKICEAIRAGASGYLLKTAGAQLVAQAILEAANGGSPMSPSIASRVVSLLAKLMKPLPQKVALSPREQELLTLMVEGLTAKEIADRMNVSIHTTGTHTKKRFTKLEVHSQAASVARSLRDELV